MVKNNFVPLPGSHKDHMSDAHSIGQPNPNEKIDITIMIRPGKESAFAPSDQVDLIKVADFAKSYDIDIIESSSEKHMIVLSGTIKNLSKAFKVDLNINEHPEIGKFRARAGSIHIPDELSSIVEGVFGLDDRPQAKPRFRILTDDSQKKKFQPRRNSKIAYEPPFLANIYGFPKGVNGKGQSIAIIQLGGGYTKQDLKKYFAKLGISKLPNIYDVSVDGGQNKLEGGINTADGEVALDIQISASIATGADIVVYFAPNTDRGFIDAIVSAVHDKKHKNTIISISWGATESSFTDQAKKAFEFVMRDAANAGISVFCAAGDNGSSDGIHDGKAHVDFPGSCPFTVSCGGTRLEVSGNKIKKEIVWNVDSEESATGGGISDFFGRPEWQLKIKMPESVNNINNKGRGIPDISAVADPNTGYLIHYDGVDYTFGGTSAVAPLLAAFTALLNEKLSRNLGFLNPILYKAVETDFTIFNDIVEGNNGDYKARPGWDACTGLGTPNGKNLLKYLQQTKE